MKHSNSKVMAQSSSMRESEQALAKLSSKAATMKGRQNVKKGTVSRSLLCRTNTLSSSKGNYEPVTSSYTYDSIDPKAFG